MTQLQKKIYDGSPKLLQQLLLNLYGIRNMWRLSQWNAINVSYNCSEHWSSTEQQRYVEYRLRVILKHAVCYVPRYINLVGMAREIDDPATDMFAILERFPVVTREEILSNPNSFISTAFNRNHLRTTATSGTTGTPFTTWIEPRALLISDGLWWRRTVWGGYQKGDWIARLVGDPVIPLFDSNPNPPWRVSWPDHRIYFSTYHLNSSTAQRIAEYLLSRRPAFLMGYPSSLDALVRLTEGKVDISSWKPKAILYSSEPMYEHQRNAIQQFINAPIRGLYGCAERVISAAQCPMGSYHLSLIDGFIEGQFGEVPTMQPARITGLLNRAMPLIRYELGDSLIPLLNKHCECGRTLPLIDPVVTKLEDSLISASGRVITPSIVTWAFKDVKGVKKSQVIQRDNNTLDVILQASAEDFLNARADLSSRLNKIFFREFVITFHRVDKLDVGASGKTRFTVNEQKDTLLKHASECKLPR